MKIWKSEFVKPSQKELGTGWTGNDTVFLENNEMASCVKSAKDLYYLYDTSCQSNYHF